MMDFDYYRPKTLDELAVLLEKTRGMVLAGGTDIIPRLRREAILSNSLVDISQVKALRFIREVGDQVEIGALTSHADILTSQVIHESAPALLQAAFTIGCPQTRYRGTIGGNLANASPAADTIPPLLTLDAHIYLDSSSGERKVQLQDFLLGPGKTVLESGEFINRIAYARPQGMWGQAFYKLGKRSGMAISIVSAAVFLKIDADGSLGELRLALGSVAPTAVRCHSVEDYLIGQKLNPDLVRQASQLVLKDISPIDDIRASVDYRRHASTVVARRVIEIAQQMALRRAA